MRALFIFLLVLNVCYLIWGVAFSVKEEQSSHEGPIQNLNMLTLLSEKSDEVVMRNYEKSFSDEQPIKTVAKKDFKKINSRVCFSIGPILEEQQVETIEAKLKQEGIEANRKTVVGKEAKSFWVYIPTAKTMEDAKLMAEELKHAKVKDYFIIRTGKNAKAISLGLYNGYKRAKLRQKNLAGMGFVTKVKTRYKEVTHYWIDIQEKESKPLNDEIWNLEDEDNVLQKVALPCVDPLPDNT